MGQPHEEKIDRRCDGEDEVIFLNTGAVKGGHGVQNGPQIWNPPFFLPAFQARQIEEEEFLWRDKIFLDDPVAGKAWRDRGSGLPFLKNRQALSPLDPESMTSLFSRFDQNPAQMAPEEKIEIRGIRVVPARKSLKAFGCQSDSFKPFSSKKSLIKGVGQMAG